MGKNPLRNQTYRKTAEEETFRVLHLLRTEKESIETGEGGEEWLEEGKGADGWWGGAGIVGFPWKHGCKLCSESRYVYISLSIRIKGRSHRMKTKART